MKNISKQSKYQEIIKKAIDDFINKHYKINPYKFIYESDIKGFLYSLILSEIDPNEFVIKDSRIENSIRGDTLPIHTEVALPSKLKNKHHFDIGIWDENDREHDYKNKRIAVAIEIKYDFEINETLKNDYTADIDRLRTYGNMKKSESAEFKGYALWFIAGIKDTESLKKMAERIKKEYYSDKKTASMVDSYIIAVDIEKNLHIFKNGDSY